MRWFEVVLYLNNQEVFRDVVRSKERRLAITNVLTNIYKGDISRAEATEVEVEIKKVIQ